MLIDISLYRSILGGVFLLYILHTSPVHAVGDEFFQSILAEHFPFLFLRESSDHHSFCYENSRRDQNSHCDENSESSAWNKDECIKNRQSPINIATRNAKHATGCCPIHIDNPQAYDLPNFMIANNGHTIELSPEETDNLPKFHWPGKDEGEYTLAQIHLHWGKNLTHGSEHNIDNIKYGMELHLVHYRSNGKGEDHYKSPAEAVKSGHGQALAVIGVMLIGGKKMPSFLEPLTAEDGAIDQVLHAKEAYHVTEKLKLSDIIKSQKYGYHYAGSLTTPPCSEIVQWIVLPDPITVQDSDIRKFISLYGGSHTYRKIQTRKTTPRLSKIELIVDSTKRNTLKINNDKGDIEHSALHFSRTLLEQHKGPGSTYDLLE